MSNVDIVVPYVDSLDPEWQKEFLKYNPAKTTEGVNAANRFRGQRDFFKFFFRCIDANLGWVRKIHLLVASESQVPAWLDKSKVHVVLHKDFIPEKFLPTFNSCTIEMFLWNIPDLAEDFIYVNDDVYFMTEVDKQVFIDRYYCRFNVIKSKLNSMYGHHCRNCYQTIYGNTDGAYLKLGHGPQPMKRSLIRNCYTKYKDKIDESISKFRSDKNMNAYLYSLYLDKIDMRRKCEVESTYVASGSIKKHNMGTINKSNIVCLNDDDPNFDLYADTGLTTTFEKLFPNKSSYEKGYNRNHRNKSRKASFLFVKETSESNYLDYWTTNQKTEITPVRSKSNSGMGYSAEEDEAFLNSMMR